jgi:hypothetical protein
MRKESRDRIIYSLNVNDIQGVSKEVLGRSLTKAEIAKVENSVGDFITWREAIENAIRLHLRKLSAAS